jgi:UDP-sulfoquinovose synthase
VFGTVVNRFAAQIVAGQPMTVYGSGHQRTGLMALDDAVASLARLVDSRPRVASTASSITSPSATSRSTRSPRPCRASPPPAASRPPSPAIHDPRGETPHTKAVAHRPRRLRRRPRRRHPLRGPPSTSLFAAVPSTATASTPPLFPPQIAWRPDDASAARRRRVSRRGSIARTRRSTRTTTHSGSSLRLREFPGERLNLNVGTLGTPARSVLAAQRGVLAR